MSSPLFTALSARTIAGFIQSAHYRVCYAAPGIHAQPAEALVAVKARNPEIQVTISLDFDEHTLRMGYGSLEAVLLLRNAGILPTHSPGFRSAVIIVDDDGWVFTPTALYLEAEPQSAETANAIRLTQDQVREVLLRLSPLARQEAIATSASPAEAAQIEAVALEVGELPLGDAQFAQVRQAIETAPPAKFDVARQVRVFEPYLQYVELSLTGAAIERKRVRIPDSLQSLGASKELEGKLKTTLDLIERGSELSAKAIETELNEIRHTLTRSLGKEHGRVILKSAKPRLLERLGQLRQKLEKHQEKVKAELQAKLDDSQKQVVAHYVRQTGGNAPDALVGAMTNVSPERVAAWIEAELTKVFPTAEDIVGRMTLSDRYKDVTFETLNHQDFLGSVKAAYPDIDWDKPFKDFKAAGEATEDEGK